MRPQARRYALLLVAAAMLALTACGGSARVTYIPDGGSYTADSLLEMLEQADPGRTARIDPEDIARSRQEALADLRGRGEDAAVLANTLTSEFPTDVSAVPFVVERGTYEGEPAWIVLEAWADAGEAPTHRRVWVFAIDGATLLGAQSLR